MGFFKDAAELDEYIGGVFREAGDHPESGPKLRADNIVMRVLYTDPEAEMTIAFRDDYQVISWDAQGFRRTCGNVSQGRPSPSALVFKLASALVVAAGNSTSSRAGKWQRVGCSQPVFERLCRDQCPVPFGPYRVSDLSGAFSDRRFERSA